MTIRIEFRFKTSPRLSLPFDILEVRLLKKNGGGFGRFLGEAFAAEPYEDADDPSNNPFAEGGATETRRARSEPGRRGDRDDDDDRLGPEEEEGTTGGGRRRRGGENNHHPLGYLFSLMNSFGINPQAIGHGAWGLAGDAGDYVWGGDAHFQNLLDDLMEQAAQNRAGPVALPQPEIDALARTTVTDELLRRDDSNVKDCTVCQDDFNLGDDLVALACRHAFHPECIVPWLQTSGTCPICRFALVPQPGQEGYVEPRRSERQDDDDDATRAEQGRDGDASSTLTMANSDLGDRNHRPIGNFVASTSSSSPPSRQSSTSRIIPTTIDNGSRLPGSWVFDRRHHHGPSRPETQTQTRQEGEHYDDDGIDAWTDAEDDQDGDDDETREARGRKSPPPPPPQTMAARAAEERRRIAASQGNETGRRDDSPVIEDVD